METPAPRRKPAEPQQLPSQQQQQQQDAGISFPCPRWINFFFWFVIWFWLAWILKYIWIYRFVLDADSRFASKVFWGEQFSTVLSFTTLACFILSAFICFYAKVVSEWVLRRCERGTHEVLDETWEATKSGAKRSASYIARHVADGTARGAKAMGRGLSTAARKYREAAREGAASINV